MLKCLLNCLFVSSQEIETAKVNCNEKKCTFCGKCQKICPQNAILVGDKLRLYYSYKCNRCKACIGACSAKALTFIEKLEEKTP